MSIQVETYRRVIRWIAVGEVGASSTVMAAYLTTRTPGDRSHPHDPSDLRRCLLLLDAVPELRTELRHMADVSPQWATLIAIWDQLEDTFRAETAAGRYAPRTYELMRGALGLL